MRILGHHNKTPINNFIKAIQEHCYALLITPHEHHIFQLEDLNKQIEAFINEISPQYPQCKSEGLKGKVYSYLTFETYNLTNKNGITLISVTSRKTKYVASFSDYDNLRYTGMPEPNRYRYTS